jgi:uncharacterized membrane protein YhaH (DUF805 family)
MRWFLMAWMRAADFSGRSRRKEYWFFHLFNVLVAIGICLIGVLLFGKEGIQGVAVCCSVYSLVGFVPSLSCTVRRLHDTGRSGWWYFISFIPLIGAIILLVFLVSDSEPGWNPYGHNPKSPEYAPTTI